jgi:hypothetical protein
MLPPQVRGIDIDWPANVEQVCNTPGPPLANDPKPVDLSAADRGRAGATFDQMAQSIAGYEASHEVTAFSSKYDAVLAGKTQFTPQEQEGNDLFRGKAKCNDCHRDGGPGEDPLFTDFTASNIGTPANPGLPYYAESEPDRLGYIANKSGTSFVDQGVGGFFTNAIRSADLRPLTHVGSRWRRKTEADSRSRHCAMSTSGLRQTLSRRTAIMATSRASSRSFIATTPAMS